MRTQLVIFLLILTFVGALGYQLGMSIYRVYEYHFYVLEKALDNATSAGGQETVQYLAR